MWRVCIHDLYIHTHTHVCMGVATCALFEGIENSTTMLYVDGICNGLVDEEEIFSIYLDEVRICGESFISGEGNYGLDFFVLNFRILTKDVLDLKICVPCPDLCKNLKSCPETLSILVFVIIVDKSKINIAKFQLQERVAPYI